MATVLDNMREVIALEQEAKSAAAKLAEVSSKLNKLGYEAKLSGWDWNKHSTVIEMCPQGRVTVNVVESSSRP